MRNGSAVGDAANSIERLDIATKQRTRVVDGAIDPTIAPDGKTIVYVNVADGARRALWRVGTDGSTARPFFSPPDTCCPGNSQGLVEIAVNRGSAAEKLDLEPGTEVEWAS